MTTAEIRAALHKGLRETRPARNVYLYPDKPFRGQDPWACALGALGWGRGGRDARECRLLAVWLLPKELVARTIVASKNYGRLAGVRILARWLRARERRGE